MWSRTAILAGLSAVGCATAPLGEFEATPTNADAYSMRLTTRGVSSNGHEAELARRASSTCGGAYKLDIDEQRVQVCTDACKGWLSTTASVTCEKAGYFAGVPE